MPHSAIQALIKLLKLFSQMSFLVALCLIVTACPDPKKKPVPRLDNSQLNPQPQPVSDSAKACLQEICGDQTPKAPSDYVSMLSKEQLKQISERYNDELKPLLKKHLEINHLDEKNENKGFNEFLNQGPDRTLKQWNNLSKKWKLLIAGTRVMFFVYPLYWSAEYNKKENKFIVSKETFLNMDWEAEGIDLNNFDIDFILEFGQRAINEGFIDPIFGLMERPAPLYFKYAYPDLSHEEAIIKEADLYLERAARLNKLFGEHFVSPNRIALGLELKENKVLSPDQWRSYLNVSFSLQIYLLTQNPSYEALLMANLPDIVDLFSRVKKSENLKAYNNLFDDTKNNHSTVKEEVLNFCEGAFYIKYATSPTWDEMIGFKARIKAMKFNTKAAVKHSLGLSDEHIKELNQEVDDYKFTDLTLQQDVIEETQTDLQKDITASKYFIESASQRSEEYNFGGAILKAGAILLNYTDSLYEYTYSYCEDELLPYTSYRDSTLNGVIQTSWQTIKNSNNQFIIAHEIAHNIYKYLTQTVLPNDKSFIFIQQMAQTYTDVYDYMRSKKYGHDLYCVAEWGQDFNSNANILQQITHEEDWADYFGAEILSKGGFLKKDKNQVCEKFAHDPEQIDELHLVSPTSGDTHSSWLLRLLRFEYKMKESLPSSCQEELEDSPFIESFSSCN